MRRRVKHMFLAGMTVLALLVAYLAALHVSGNFHEVSAGTVYRAAQMDGQALARWKREYGIASVLNLRGESNGADWYETERAVADRLGIQHIDFRMSASTQLDAEQVKALLEVMRTAPKPMLIHCMGGADRTGLASALYVAGIDKSGEDAAEWQLSLRYGHIGIPWLSKAWPMNTTWEDMEAWLGFPDS
ncbi:dual specificity protein phosphatase family protein [Paracoccus sp. 11-3]|uniref:Dual specificity protein phosphatase family protein n=1 Tax=Paracoccus amoyensis TaxID=2760093 RepID=A0A926JDR4_9RHOB|nr:dual specificity protein phosphatase family protein [Paracoccus amoyensis]MBC9248470.1 dual specificity protein phosphatase family protein [Paracoccus amoyensis]